MEYIPNEELEQLSAYLTDLTLGSSRLNGKIEAFTSRYRKPTRISRGRFHMRKKTNQGDEDIDDEGNEGTNRVAAVPSYLATGLIFDDTQQTNSADVSMTIDLTSSSASSVPFEGFAPSSSSGGSTVALAFNESLLTMPRRQRSFSFTSCYTMRKPARRRTSSLGDLTEPSSRILLLDLVTALNESFPDYDFGDTKIEQFKDQDLPAVVSHINSYLAELTVKDPLTLERMWSGIDEVVNLRQCEIFQFSPEKNDDDDADANLWEFHYFFFNKDLHAICYFNCYAESALRRKNVQLCAGDDSDDSEMDYEDDEEVYPEQQADVSRSFVRDGEDDEDYDYLDRTRDDDENMDESTEMPDWDGII